MWRGMVTLWKAVEEDLGQKSRLDPHPFELAMGHMQNHFGAEPMYHLF